MEEAPNVEEGLRIELVVTFFSKNHTLFSSLFLFFPYTQPVLSQLIFNSFGLVSYITPVL
jgi:hypothetical protein